MQDDEKIKELREEYNKNDKSIVKHKIFNKVRLVDLVIDNDTSINMNFSLEIKTYKITD